MGTRATRWEPSVRTREVPGDFVGSSVQVGVRSASGSGGYYLPLLTLEEAHALGVALEAFLQDRGREARRAKARAWRARRADARRANLEGAQ